MDKKYDLQVPIEVADLVYKSGEKVLEVFTNEQGFVVDFCWEDFKTKGIIECFEGGCIKPDAGAFYISSKDCPTLWRIIYGV